MIPFNANEKVCNQRSGVYAIVNIKTEKFYIGSAVKLNKRKNEHLSLLRKGKHHSIYLQRSYNKYGEDVFIFKVLEYVEDKNNLLKVEQKYLDIYYPTGITYNICGIAGSPLGVKRSEEARKKMSLMKQNQSVETRRRISEGNKGKILSDETKKKISEANKGRFFSDETRRKLSEVKQKPIIQLDKNNNFVAKFNSIIEAERETKIIFSGISQCCRGKMKTAGGYLWMFETDYLNGKIPDENNLIDGNSKPVLQLTKNNELVKRYNSILEAKKETGISNGNISSCCSGKRTSAGGFIWQYESLYNQN